MTGKHIAPRLCRAMLLTIISYLLLIGCTNNKAIEPDQSPSTDKPPVTALEAEANKYASNVEGAVAKNAKPATEDVRWLPLGPGQAPPAPPKPSKPKTTHAAETIKPKPTPRETPMRPLIAASSQSPRPSAKHTPAPNSKGATDVQLTQKELVKRLAWTLDAEARNANASLRPYIARAALSLSDPATELTEADLPQLTPTQRKLVLAYQRTFTQLGQTLTEGGDEDVEALRDAVEELSQQINAWQKLKIRNVRLCSRVDGYGNYQVFGNHTFLAGRAQPMIVYAELDHFAVQSKPDGKYVVQLTQEVTLYNESDGLPVWRQKPVPIKDESLNRRRDFFVVQIITLSERLTVGKYLMKVTVTDEIGKAVDEMTVPIQIVADPNLAGNAK